MARTRSLTGWDVVAVAAGAVGVLGLSLTANSLAPRYAANPVTHAPASAISRSWDGWHWSPLVWGAFIVLAVTGLLLVRNVVPTLARVISSGYEGGLIGVAALAFFLELNRALTFPSPAPQTTIYSFGTGGWLVLGGGLTAVLASLLSWAVHRGAFRRTETVHEGELVEATVADHVLDLSGIARSDVDDVDEVEPDVVALDVREPQEEPAT